MCLLSLHIHFSLLSIFHDFCHFDPCVVVFHVISFRLFSFLMFGEFVNLSFPSLLRSSHWSVCLVLGTETWVPFCCFLCPSLVWKRCNPHCQTPFHSSVCFNPQWNFGCLHPFNGYRCASCHVFNSFFLFNFNCVNLFIGVFHKRDVTVLVAIYVLYCYPRQLHHLSHCGLLFPLLHFPRSCWSAFSF